MQHLQKWIIKTELVNKDDSSKETKCDNRGSELDIFRFENGDSKEKIRRDVGLHEAMSHILKT